MEWMRRDIGGEREEMLIVMTFCATMASLDAAYAGYSGGAPAKSELRHGAVIEEAVQHIRSAIGVSGENRWPLACLQESSAF